MANLANKFLQYKFTDEDRTAAHAAISTASMDPAGFSWSECDSPFDPGQRVPQLVHRASGAYFTFDVDPTRHGRPAFSYTSHAADTEPTFGRAMNRQHLLARLPEWLAVLRPDATLTEHRAVAEVTDTETPAAHRSKPVGLADVFGLVSLSHRLTSARLSAVDSQLTLLVTAGTRIGKREWVLLGIGTALSVVLPMVVPPEQAARIFENAISEIFQAIGNGLK